MSIPRLLSRLLVCFVGSQSDKGTNKPFPAFYNKDKPIYYLENHIKYEKNCRDIVVNNITVDVSQPLNKRDRVGWEETRWLV